MPKPKSQESISDPSRRGFLKATAGVATAGALPIGPLLAQGGGGSVAIVTDEADSVLRQPSVEWALDELQAALKAKGVSTQLHQRLGSVSGADETILVARRGSDAARPILDRARVTLSDAAESTALVRGEAEGRSVLLVSGSDARGLGYGLLEAADRVTHAAAALPALGAVRDVAESPANPIRSVTRYFESDIEDKSWFYDKSFWGPYLSMLMKERFNRFSMAFGLGYNRPRDVHDAYFYFTYPFLFSVPGYQVRVAELPDEERDRNLEMLRWIGRETVKRGLHFQVALWTHAYQWIDSPEANYTIDGLTPDKHGAYCRDAIHKLLLECPEIDGVTIRAHSESGVPEGSYDFWQALFEGVRRAGRRVEIDIHSKGIEHKLLDMALATGNPVNVSPKYWAEHMGLPYHQAAIRERERVPTDRPPERIETQRRFTRYGYGDYLREDREYGVLYRIWPGTQRTLLWGDPAMAAGYGRYAHFCGSLGLELSEPLSFKGRMGSGRPGGRNAYADASLSPAGGDWRKHAYTYRLWGRLLYNPEASPETWRRQLKSEFGPAARDCEVALARASRVLPLVTVAHHPSASNNSYWPEIYTNMPIVAGREPQPYRDTRSPRRFGTVSSLDPELFSSADEFAGEVLAGARSGKYSPLDVARWLDADARSAERHVSAAKAKAADSRSPALRRLAVDVRIQSALGRFFAEKLRAAVAYELYELSGDAGALKKAVARYTRARDAWKQAADVADGVYVDDISYGLTPHLRGHWKDRLPAIEEDLAAMEKLAKQASASGSSGAKRTLPEGVDLGALFAAAAVPRPRSEHLPPASFHPGRPLKIEMALESGHRASRARLHYRHANQDEIYRVEEMEFDGGRYGKTIPGACTDSPYPLVYFFEIFDAQGRAWMYPGLGANFSNQPYFVVRRG